MLAYGFPLISVDLVVFLCEINMEVLKKMDNKHKTPMFFLGLVSKLSPNHLGMALNH